MHPLGLLRGLSVLVLRRHLLGTVCCGKNYLSLHANLKVAATASKELNPNFGKGDGSKAQPGTDNDAPLWYKTSYNQPTERRRDEANARPTDAHFSFATTVSRVALALRPASGRV